MATAMFSKWIGWFGSLAIFHTDGENEYIYKAVPKTGNQEHSNCFSTFPNQ
jgi:hypothetical protein